MMPRDILRPSQPVPRFRHLSERSLPLTTPTISDAAVLEQLRRAAQDPDVVVRHLAGYALGNVSGPDSLEQLRVMLTDGNRHGSGQCGDWSGTERFRRCRPDVDSTADHFVSTISICAGINAPSGI